MYDYGGVVALLIVSTSNRNGTLLPIRPTEVALLIVSTSNRNVEAHAQIVRPVALLIVSTSNRNLVLVLLVWLMLLY